MFRPEYASKPGCVDPQGFSRKRLHAVICFVTCMVVDNHNLNYYGKCAVPIIYGYTCIALCVLQTVVSLTYIGLA